MRRKILSIITLVIPVLLLTTSATAQQDKEPSPFTVGGYLEVYYIYDFSRPVSNSRPGFLYSFNRHNEVSLNLGFIRGSYHTDRVRANLALMTGTYPNANLAAEPGILKNIFEANAGVKLSATKELWVDAGIFASHIGFESAIGKDCWNLTRSILAENSPYYEAGARISYNSDNGKWFLSGLLLNGWQRIQRVDGNSFPSFGTQATFKPGDAVTLNSSSFIGTDTPDSARLMRYFHNFYGIFQVSEKVGVIVGFDYGIQQTAPESGSYNRWMSPVIIAKFTITDKVAVAVRGEYYVDENGVIIATGTPNGFKTAGLSTNLDYQVSPNVVWRLEARNFSSKDDIFVEQNESTKNNTFIGTSLAVSF